MRNCLPPELLAPLLHEIRVRWGNALRIAGAEPVRGGDIHQAARLLLSDGRRLFVKYNARPLPRIFAVEYQGLARIRATQTLRVPEAYAFRDATAEHPAFLLLEWIDAEEESSSGMREFGRRLARMHRHSADHFGLDHDNYIGTLPQRNPPTRSWVEFYRDHRLGVQQELAATRGYLPPRRRERLERLRARLDRLLDDAQSHPSLLHGDLWRGNFLFSQGQAVLLDPAIYYGDREVEIAFTELFGGFPPAFYEGYTEVWPLDPDYAERKALYQLYPLLVHLNLFGESYGSRVDRVLQRYVG